VPRNFGALLRYTVIEDGVGRGADSRRIDMAEKRPAHFAGTLVRIEVAQARDTKNGWMPRSCA
jgi:hypothetical protein